MIQLNKPTECESHDAQTLHVRLVKVAAARTGAESYEAYLSHADTADVLRRTLLGTPMDFCRSRSRS
ncbi:hypothetical protein CTAM01_03917 [Colletotrichum tamarilloi]|uniref:Uncharacterized protein n=1 Tax=Colletotrichum tamarilloi TaxID=1209934 RepID=A0ABQ9RIY5_9PEZI|nr:uncharacterized protein CTAM01_03917 [Colletotrichum tamarilloi]KAK1504610.1 hypothetical protein CTAM01_03917 [Colletotrichum tamarilloi]